MTDQTPEQAFAAALAAFQGEIPHVGKDSTANVKSDRATFSYAYADLTAITEAAMPVLTKHGLSFTAFPTFTETGAFVLRYRLRHAAGHAEGGDYPLNAGATPQQIGSAITYGRRYCLCAATGIAPGGEDDDGARASETPAADPLRAPSRAQRTRPDPQAPDAWTTDPDREPKRVTDAAWIDGFRQRVTAATNTRELLALQGEANGIWSEGRLSPEDAQALRCEVSERAKELTGVPA